MIIKKINKNKQSVTLQLPVEELKLIKKALDIVSTTEPKYEDVFLQISTACDVLESGKLSNKTIELYHQHNSNQEGAV